MLPRLHLSCASAALLLGAFTAMSAPAGANDSSPRSDDSESRESNSDARIYADSFLVWIYAEPKRDPAPIGYLRGGQSAKLRSYKGRPANQRVKRGCGKGWYAVQPAGFVCLDHRASLKKTRYFQSMKSLAPEPGAHPFEYALSMGTPSYRRVPTEKEWLKREREFGAAKVRPLPPHWRGHEELVGEEFWTASPTPTFLSDASSVSREREKRLERRDVPFGSMLAITQSFKENGRLFLQSADGTVVPAERMRPFKHSAFEGIDLTREGSPKLPIAWPRKKTRKYAIKSTPACAIDGSGTSAQSKVRARGKEGQLGDSPAQLKANCLLPLESWGAPRQAIQLSGRVTDVAGTRFAETINKKGQSAWLPTRYLYLAEKRTLKGKRSESGELIEADGSVKKWIHFTISQGTLVSYSGDTPVFATLASPGIGGTPPKGADPLETRTTPVGSFRIQFKHLTDDMSPEQTEHRKFWIADVPYAMYFKQPFAIHVAYWHESFGEPMSGGCINVSPRDGARLFDFTAPHLPEGWYGVGSSRAFGLGTSVVIER